MTILSLAAYATMDVATMDDLQLRPLDKIRPISQLN